MKKHDKPTQKYHCEVCNKTFETLHDIKKHTQNTHTAEVQLNCDNCQFQASSGPELRKHMNSKRHKAANGVDVSKLGETIKCKTCSQEFIDWWNLMNHRQDAHPDQRRRCRNNLND